MVLTDPMVRHHLAGDQDAKTQEKQSGQNNDMPLEPQA